MSEKSNKELAVELAASALQAMAQMQSFVAHKPFSSADIKNILNDCYSAVCNLDDGK